MKEPKRLFETGSPLERTILGYGRDEQPEGDLARRTLAAMAAVAAPVTAAPPPPKLAAFTRSRALVAGAAAVGLGTILAVTIAGRPQPPAPESPATRNAPVAASSNVIEEREPVVTPDALPNAPAPTAAPSSSARPAARVVPAASASIAREVELLDGVKARLAAGDPNQAGHMLDAYDAEFPVGTLRPEATVLRIRTQLARGDRAAAEKLGGEFLAQHPTGIHAKRVRALLGQDRRDDDDRLEK